MSETAMDLLIDRDRVITRVRELGSRTDAEMLRLFALDRDEAAFELLVRRHGTTVWGRHRRGHVPCPRIIRSIRPDPG